MTGEAQLLPPLEPPPPPPEGPPPAPKGRDSVILGFLSAIGMHLLAGMFSLALGPLALVFLLGIGLVQLVYLLPVFLMWRKEWPRYATGVAICMGLTFLVNAACWNALSQI